MANELILVVEDNDMSRKLVRDVLTVKGYTIVEAETGEEGVRLPGIDGIQALERLCAEVATQGIPAMAMTASVMTGDRPRVLDAGFDERR
jgi:two-component system cell cycle response regulator DivK